MSDWWPPLECKDVCGGHFVTKANINMSDPPQFQRRTGRKRKSSCSLTAVRHSTAKVLDIYVGLADSNTLLEMEMLERKERERERGEIQSGQLVYLVGEGNTLWHQDRS